MDVPFTVAMTIVPRSDEPVLFSFSFSMKEVSQATAFFIACALDDLWQEHLPFTK